MRLHASLPANNHARLFDLTLSLELGSLTSRIQNPETMPPAIQLTQHNVANVVARGAVAYLMRRDGLKVKGAQGVTLGVIAAYIVGIAILWNVPYLRYILWPFKVSPNSRPISLG